MFTPTGWKRLADKLVRANGAVLFQPRAHPGTVTHPPRHPARAQRLGVHASVASHQPSGAFPLSDLMGGKVELDG